MSPFAPGVRGGPGRPKGSKTLTSRRAAEQVLEALDELGGVTWLVDMARRRPAIFASLLRRILPQSVAVEAEIRASWERMVEQWRAVEAVEASPAAQLPQDGLQCLPEPLSAAEPVSVSVESRSRL